MLDRFGKGILEMRDHRLRDATLHVVDQDGAVKHLLARANLRVVAPLPETVLDGAAARLDVLVEELLATEKIHKVLLVLQHVVAAHRTQLRVAVFVAIHLVRDGPEQTVAVRLHIVDGQPVVLDRGTEEKCGLF